MNRWTTGPAYAERLRDALATGGADPDAERRDAIVAWLARLRRLHGVPFHYLVPDPRMLPRESIRFFQVDQNWIDCLVDGAYSIGRSTTSDAARQHVAPARADDDAGYTASGFLLRSAVVSGWPGLEVKGYAAGGTRVTIGRFERVASDILLCLFEGVVERVTFSEAPEILHFGLVMPESPADPYLKILKWVAGGGPSHPPGSEMRDATDMVTVTAPVLDKRVVDVSALAARIHDTLVAHGGIASGAPFTPAEFGLEMIQGVEEAEFRTATGEER